jgi:hypothetical protein
MIMRLKTQTTNVPKTLRQSRLKKQPFSFAWELAQLT